MQNRAGEPDAVDGGPPRMHVVEVIAADFLATLRIGLGGHHDRDHTACRLRRRRSLDSAQAADSLLVTTRAIPLTLLFRKQQHSASNL